MNISGEVWFEVYQCGTPYCAINNTKKKKNKKETNKKPFDTWQTSEKFRENVWENVHVSNRVVYVYLCLRVYNYKTLKESPNHGVRFPCMILYAYHTWRWYFLTYEKNSTSSFVFFLRTIFLFLQK